MRPRHAGVRCGPLRAVYPYYPGKLLDAAKVLGLDRIFAQVDWGGLPAGLVGESIARYATEIAPALGA